MKLFKVTYEKLSHPSEGIFIKECERYYTCSSLDRLYDYVENEEGLTIVSISILKCISVQERFPSDIHKNQLQSLSTTKKTKEM